MDPMALVEVGLEAAAAVRRALDGLDDWGLAGTRAGQHRSDLAADEAALAVVHAAGLGSLSEESGRHHPDRPLVAVVDPLDGSTNAHRGVPWFATSVCVVDRDGPLAAAVVDQASGRRCWATRGGGAFAEGERLRTSGCTELADAVVGLSGWPPGGHLGWSQFRALGAAALDLCAVAGGVLDAWVDGTRPAAHGPWDYLGGLLVAMEAGAVAADAGGLDLVALGHRDRRSPVVAASPALLDELLRRAG